MGYFAPELLGYIVAEWWRTFVGISIPNSVSTWPEDIFFLEKGTNSKLMPV